MSDPQPRLSTAQTIHMMTLILEEGTGHAPTAPLGWSSKSPSQLAGALADVANLHLQALALYDDDWRDQIAASPAILKSWRQGHDLAVDALLALTRHWRSIEPDAEVRAVLDGLERTLPRVRARAAAEHHARGAWLDPALDVAERSA